MHFDFTLDYHSLFLKRVRYRGYYMAAEIRNFSSSVEKYFTRERSERVKYFFNTRRESSYLQAAM